MNTNKAIYQILGWYGLVAILSAYCLITFSLLTPHSLIYQLLNLTGSVGIALETYQKKDYQPFFLNIIWMLIAAVGIISAIFL
jgi:hypothetical protein